MSISIHFGGRIEHLAQQLAQSVLKDMGQQDLFDEITIVVPNSNLAKWLRFTLAEQNGIAVNLSFPFFEKGLWELSRALLPADPPLIRLTYGMLRKAVLAMIMDSMDRNEQSAVNAYCRNRDGTYDPADPECAQRLWQISGRLAEHFHEYEYSRPEMVQAWLNNTSWTGLRNITDPERRAKAMEMESVQRALYYRIFESGGGLLARTAPHTQSLYQMNNALPDADAPQQERPVYFFGLSQLSRTHCHLLYRLSHFYRLQLYHFNVCSEYWEDITTPAENRWRSIRNAGVNTDADEGEELDLSIENELLRAWGKAGRETVKLLSELEEAGNCIVEWVDEEEPSDSNTPTVLGAVQQSIRSRTSDIQRVRQDDSIQVTGCPGIFREVETVYESILANMLEPGAFRVHTGDALTAHKVNTSGLRLTDIAVLVPDMPGYRPAIDSVFGSRGELDYNLIDSNAAEDSVYATALMKMLALPGSPFTRRALFDLFFNPCFLAGNNLRREDAVTWLAWAEELGVFHSFDDAHRRQQGLIEGEQFTWQQALRRIRLGRIMPHEPSRHMPDIPSAFDRYPPHADMQTGGWTADRFSETVERLFHRLNELAVARLDRPTWAARIQSLMDDFLGIPAEYAGESYVHQCLAAYLLQLAGKDDSHGPGLLQRDMPLTLIRQMLQDSLSTVPCGRGRYLVDGITIAALLPMRPIPFRIVYILGLNEGQFPRDIERSSLDLRHCRRRIGDVSRPDAGRYIFLENMLTARGKLYLSYVNLDLVKDEEKFPSPVIRQLVDFVNGCVLEPDTRFQENNIPFHAGSPVRKPPPGKRETEALRDFGKETFRIESLLAANAHQNMPPDLTRQLEAYVQQHPHSETAHRIKAFLQAMQGSAETAAPANTAQPDPPETVQIDVRDLARFLADPVEAYVRYHLGLYDRNDDGIEAALCEHEPLASSFPEDYELITSTMAAWFRSGNDEDVARETFDRLYKRLQHSSRCPEAVYGQADRDKLWDHVIAERIEQCWKHGPKDKAQSVLIGNSRIYEQIPDIRIPSPLILHNVLLENGRTVQVELSGFFELTWGRPAAGNIHLLALTKSLQQRRDRPPRHILRPFLFGLVWLLHSTTAECCFYAGVPVAARKTAGLFGPQWFGYRYTRQAAENYLTGLVKAYLDEQRPKLLPYDILQHATALDAEHLQRAIDAELLSDSAYGRHYSPSDLVTLFLDQLRVPADAQDVVQQRIGPVWDCEQKEHSV